MPIRWRRNTASRRRSWFPLPEPPLQQPTQAAQLLITQVPVGDEIGQEHLGRAVEHLVHKESQGAAARRIPLDQRMVAVRPPLPGMPHVALLLEGAQYGENGRVGE